MARVRLAALALVTAGACGGGSSLTGAGGVGASVTGVGGAGGAAGGGATGGVPDSLLDPARTTTWNPGILADGQLHLPLGADGLPVRTTVCANPAPGADLQMS